MEINEEILGRYKAMYSAALAAYVEDCRGGLHERRTKDRLAHQAHCVAAIEDLLGPRTQLGWLCDALELNTDTVAARIMSEIQDIRPLGKNGASRRPPMTRARTASRVHA